MPIENREKAYYSPPNIQQEGEKSSLRFINFSMKNRPCGTIPNYGTVNSHVNYCQNTIRNEEVISHNFFMFALHIPPSLSSLGSRIETKVLATQEDWPGLLSLSLLITPEFLQAYPD